MIADGLLLEIFSEERFNVVTSRHSPAVNFYNILNYSTKFLYFEDCREAYSV